MEDTAVYIQAIESFEEKQDPLSEELDRFISYIARTGDILGPWEKVQKVFMKKLTLVLDEFYNMAPYKVGKVNANSTNDDFDEMKNRLLQLTEEFDSPPFTIQRLCELLTEPRKNYTKCDKFMRGLEKNLMVVSSWSNLPRRLSESNDVGMVNGVDAVPSNGYTPGSDRFKPHWANLPPSPISTTPPKIPGAPDFTAVMFPKLEVTNEAGETTKEEETQKTTEIEESPESKPTDVEGTTSETSDETGTTQAKSNISATIISSSPPKTVNIKRKIEESSDTTTSETDTTEIQIAESPTKKLKSDTEDEKELEEQEKKVLGETSTVSEEGISDDSANLSTDKPENMELGDSAKIEQSDSAKVDKEKSAESSLTNTETVSTISDLAKTSEPDSQDTSVDQNTVQTDNLASETIKPDNSVNADGNVGTSVDPPTESTEKSGETDQMEVD